MHSQPNSMDDLISLFLSFLCVCGGLLIWGLTGSIIRRMLSLFMYRLAVYVYRMMQSRSGTFVKKVIRVNEVLLYRTLKLSQ